MAKVSLLVSVYNLEDYIEATLRSLMAQTYRDVEIIVVDDGSTDGSREVVAALAAEDPRITLIAQENGGVPKARQTAIDAATGDFIMVLDGDDLFEPAMVEHMLAKAEAGDAVGKPVDVVVCRSDQFDHNTGAVTDMVWTVRMEQLPAEDPFAPTQMGDYLFSAFNGWAWDKLIRRQLVIDEGLEFPNLKNSEDFPFVFGAEAAARHISVCDEVLAHYRNNRGTSISGSRQKAPEEFYKGICLLKERLQAGERYSFYRWGYLNWALDYTLWNITTMIDCPQRTALVEKLVTGGFPELELDVHGQAYFSLYPRSVFNYELLRAEYEGVDAPKASAAPANPRLGLVAEAMQVEHQFGTPAVKYVVRKWKARKAASGGDLYRMMASKRGTLHWNLKEK